MTRVVWGWGELHGSDWGYDILHHWRHTLNTIVAGCQGLRALGGSTHSKAWNVLGIGTTFPGPLALRVMVCSKTERHFGN